jgi:hypothetical protein
MVTLPRQLSRRGFFCEPARPGRTNPGGLIPIGARENQGEGGRAVGKPRLTEPTARWALRDAPSEWPALTQRGRAAESKSLTRPQGRLFSANAPAAFLRALAGW